MLRDNGSNLGDSSSERSPTAIQAWQGSRSRAAFFFAVLLAGTAAAGNAGAADCTELPEAQQAACWMEAGCRRLSDHEKRTECLRLAANLRRALETEAAPVDSAERTEPKPSPAAGAPAAGGEAAASVRDDSDPQQEQPAVSVPPRADIGQTVVAKVDAEAVSEHVVDRTVLDIPNRFSADITALRRLVRDRQLVAVDNQLLFEGDVSAESALKLGDRVEIRRISRAFGERYRIIGPSQRPIMARRISCERVELSKQSRRRCLMVANDRVE